jgi:hypothetical protein
MDRVNKTARMVAVALLGLLVGLLAPIGGALGHPEENYYARKWGNDRLPTITWAFDEDVPSGSGWRARIREGADEWDSVQPSAFQFEDIGEVVKSYSADCDDYGLEANVLFHRGIDSAGQVLATTAICQRDNPDKIKTFIMSFDSFEDWHVGTGNPPTVQECLTSCPDLRAIATHEFGHGTGGWTTASLRDHFDATNNPESCGAPGATDYHTMCAKYEPSRDGDPARGARWRSLEVHDRHTFGDAY